MSDAYEIVGGTLKLKGVKDGGVKKKLVTHYAIIMVIIQHVVL